MELGRIIVSASTVLMESIAKLTKMSASVLPAKTELSAMITSIPTRVHVNLGFLVQIVRPMMKTARSPVV
jgi:hypothetical protein